MVWICLCSLLETVGKMVIFRVDVGHWFCSVRIWYFEGCVIVVRGLSMSLIFGREGVVLFTNMNEFLIFLIRGI